MQTRVAIPPDPIVTPADVPGDHASDDPTVAALIAAATEEIDGPDGWLGRSFGPQTLILSAGCWSDIERLPYGPVIAVDSITYIASDGTETLLDDSNWTVDGDYIYFGSSWSEPTLANRTYSIKVQYQTGYDGEDLFAGGTGDVPERVKQAIIEAVQNAMSLDIDDVLLRSVEIPDVMTKTYSVSTEGYSLIRRVIRERLAGLRVMYV